MKKFVILFVVSLSMIPGPSFAGFNYDKFALDGQFIMSAASRNIDDYEHVEYGAQLRVGMEVRVASNMVFGSRLYAYKYLDDFDKTFDKTDRDTIREERAYFKWWNVADSNFHFSIGRRLFFYGQAAGVSIEDIYSDASHRSPSDFNVDGVTVGYFLEPLTGITGMNVRLCYGLGIKKELGNGTRVEDKNLEDAELGGISFDLYYDDKTLIIASFFRAKDINDGFNGTFASPTEYASLFAPTMNQDMQEIPSLNFVTRYVPTTTIGDINLVGLNASHKLDNGLVLFGSITMTQLRPNGKAGMFGGMGTDAVYRATLTEDGSEIVMSPAYAENDDHREGYGVYVGVQIPAPMGKFGLEYNYGSKYWTPVNQVQDDVLGNKLVTRGHVGEAYYIFDFNQTASVQVGGIYYNYEYTGSGSPVGEPQKIRDIKNGTAYSLMPVVDEVWDAYAKIIITF